MNKSFLVAFLATISACSILNAEPSAFGAGDLDNSKPYGLTSSEKVILQNKKNLKKVVVKSNNQANRVDSLRERIDGLQTIIEGLSKKSQENKFNLKSLDKKNSDELLNVNEYEKRLSVVSQKNSQDIQKLQELSDELSLLLKDINKNYVSKDKFNILVNDFNKFRELVVKELKTKSTSTKSKFDGMSNAKIAKEARKLYDKKYYTKSMEYYLHLIEKNYKPARAHYMVGEMKYYRKNYSDAIAYFKKSASSYSKASYMPLLMLHTAVAMQKTGDNKNAISFYKGIISKYPDSSQASTAKNKLNKMK
ncbi:tetratricopeptide repeat protein [Sulfurimonas sp.]|uniref:tetratricopeptide repeat protein n=1 Tax=Sulfurimonas sp. TaxID=2022749 RepID=UPI002AB16755|nr:tetratricopeptide repeat protein [Sulfurimonas sp.]